MYKNGTLLRLKFDWDNRYIYTYDAVVTRSDDRNVFIDFVRERDYLGRITDNPSKFFMFKNNENWILNEIGYSTLELVYEPQDNTPEVELVTFTPNPEQVLQNAYSECYQKPIRLDKMVKVLKHDSVLEHVSFTFKFKCSRVCLSQLTRHRMASPTIQSHRYSDIMIDDTHYYIPDSILSLPEEVINEWIDDCELSYELYKKWADRGIKKEDARYLINMGVGINGTMTFNLRSLINFFALRTDNHAQEEIRKLADRMMELVFEQLPNLREELLNIVESRQE